MKPSPMMTKGIFFQSNGSNNNEGNKRKNDNDSPSLLSNYWSSMSSTVELKRARIEESLNYYITTKSRLLLKVLAACISIALIGFIVSSLLSPHHQHNNHHHRPHQLLINNRDINKTIESDSSSKSINYSSPEVTTTSSTSPITTQIRNDLRFSSQASSSSSTSPAANVITTQNEQHLQPNQFNEDYSKSYVRKRHLI